MGTMRLKACLITAILMFFAVNNSFALTAQSFDFESQIKNLGHVTSWTQTLRNTDFHPTISSNTIIQVTEADLKLNFTYTPVWVAKDHQYEMSFALKVDGIDLGNTYTYKSSSSKAVNKELHVSIMSSVNALKVLQAISDKSAIIAFDIKYGTLNRVNQSKLHGDANEMVAPEPASIYYVATGFAGLLAYRRLRKPT